LLDLRIVEPAYEKSERVPSSEIPKLVISHAPRWPVSKSTGRHAQPGFSRFSQPRLR
jgi:hypothetical protein